MPDGTSPSYLFTAQSLAAVGNFFVGGTEPPLGCDDRRRFVFGKLNAGADLTAGRWDAIITYYAKMD